MDNEGNIITQGVLMAEELNIHFSAVFTREDTSSLPAPETKFEGSEGERLGQLVVTPEVVANKINNMKENKSPVVDGIAPKIYTTKIDTFVCPPNISETVAVRLLKLAHRSRIASTTKEIISKQILLSILSILF